MAALTLDPEEVELVREPRILFPPPESGMVHRRNTLPRSYPALRKWRVRWHTLSPPGLETLRLLWHETRGGSVSFDWTPPGGSPVRAKFLTPLSWRAASAQSFAVELFLEETR